MLAKELLSYDEPIPNFATRFPNILESCLATPFQSFSRKSLYPGLISKASILFYLLVEKNPFQNGNKRIAMTTLLVFLYMNKKWIKADLQEFYNFAIWIASSPPQFKDEVVKAIEKFLKSHIIKLN
ncbi:MAG: type II toxin-antitoxin system death-on-curing family toxin [Candidatus Hodarchaeales archaeon]|jgi:death-on-curing family protein